MSKQNILVLGATGASGLAFIKESLTHPTSPTLTLLIRTPSKLPKEYQDHPSITIITGQLDDPVALKSSLQNGITTVVSFLGAYISLSAFLYRTRETPIADSLPILFNAMRESDVRRILALSTPHALPQPQDVTSWAWWRYGLIVDFVAPQGNAEMKGIGERVSELGEEMEWTVFRVPHLNDGSAEEEVEAGFLGEGFGGSMELSRASLARWVLGEIGEGRWVGKAPVVGNRA
ncbi:hypothetical protein FKW77_002453 [Venturia effusa]|uniref:NAD(P)-binding domain-containing protein n=1 Tax=Venturia effusa TaxID=50376 RepID=A0A517LQZ5_9PEZI|nr:hypothetical protein FKW77_002453 [Venturia effusa]